MQKFKQDFVLRQSSRRVPHFFSLFRTTPLDMIDIILDVGLSAVESEWVWLSSDDRLLQIIGPETENAWLPSVRTPTMALVDNDLCNDLS